MERDLHDGAQQQILATIIQLRLLSDRVPTELKDSVQKVSEQATAALETVREVARGMYSPKLAAAGLPMALRAQGAGAPYELEISADEPFPRFEQHVETAVYYCCLEALQNAAKHAAAKRVNLSIHADESRLTFSIADNGRGFEPATSRQGVGTQSMRDRIAALGGELTITSAPGEGTSVEGWVPAHPAMPVEAGSRPDVVSEQTLR
jgi:signal transduction histidine kinase